MPCIELGEGFYGKLRREASERDVSVGELVAENLSEALSAPSTGVARSCTWSSARST